MAKRSKIKTDIPREILEDFNAKLVQGGFADYDGLTDWLNERLQENGLNLRISRSSAFRYGQEFQEQFERDMSEQRQLYSIAKTALADNQDPEGVVREATIRTMQTRLLRLSIALREAEENGEDPLYIAEVSSKISRAVSALGKTDILSQKYKAEIKKQIQQEAAAAITSAAKAEGVSEQGITRIRQALGFDH